MMVGLTPDAIKVRPQAQEYLKAQLNNNMRGIRFMILTGKGCGGNEYDIKPIMQDDDVSADDALDLGDGLTIYIPKKDTLRFFGCEIDFITDSLGSKRIAITNPNETARCGCGESVSF